MSAEEIRAQSYVGFDSITQQIEHKLLKRGFQFNVIVVGELFLFYNSKDVGAESTRPERCLVISFPVRAIFRFSKLTLYFQDRLAWGNRPSSTQSLPHT